MECEQLRDIVQNFRFHPQDAQGYNRVLLQLFGYLGHGKSSFINSCKFVLDGEYKIIAEAGIKDGGLTMERKSYRVTDSITLVDNRGFGFMNDFEKIEIYAQLGNFLPLDETVVWREDFGEIMGRIEDADMDPNYSDYTVPVFIYSVQKMIHTEEESEVKRFLKACQEMTGIVPIVVLTHKTSANYIAMEQKFKCLGAEVVIGVENYTSDDHRKTIEKHMGILNILKNALEDVQFHVNYNRDLRRERIERKKFLLRMVHDSVTAKKQKEDSRSFNPGSNPTERQRGTEKGSSCMIL
ncbi:uncharacterized protein LOC128501188 isoform X1 [Spea bombifrons]|uniref:uncharacterized protein LOC128501188 isoform X1 n=1 Tax=Spea bombifrons TaxID=233779 RepID=UPI002349E5AB|nr:uncharacterized protein LOC128501188 isoform X1 [Spea bombifrons]